MIFSIFSICVVFISGHTFGSHTTCIFRDRKPRSPASTADSPSEMTGGNSEYYDDDTTLATKDDTVMEASTAAYASSRGTGRSSRTAEGEGNSKLITQPLASGFARRSADEEVVESGEDSDE